MGVPYMGVGWPAMNTWLTSKKIPTQLLAWNLAVESRPSLCLLLTTLCERFQKQKPKKTNRNWFKTHKNDVNTYGFLCRDWTNWMLWESWLCRRTDIIDPPWEVYPQYGIYECFCLPFGRFWGSLKAPQLEWEIDGPQIAPNRFRQGLKA